MANRLQDSAPTVVAVLGMHRSGTSALTGSLELHGLFLGEVNRNAPHNPRGNHEHQPIRLLHDAVLADSGGAWHSPPADVVWTQERRMAMREIIEGFSGHPHWGFKDPRTLLTLRGWLDELPDMVLVGTFRHPQSVVDSIVTRQPEFGEERALDLWMEYNRRLLDLASGGRAQIVCFDASTSDYLASVGRLASKVGLPVHANDRVFYETALRQPTADWSGVPGDARQLYCDLVAQAL